MAGRAAGTPPATLLERDDAVGELERLVARATHGQGTAVVVEGSAGLGKTALMEWTVDAARAHGASVLHARATEFEATLGFGVVRQLLEPPLRAMDDAARERALEGAAGLAGPILSSAKSGDASNRFAVLHGLYWFLARMAEDAPVLLAVDDGQWVDDPSREWLRYLALRLDSLPVLTAVTSRPTRDAEPMLEPDTTRIVLRALGIESVSTLAARRLGHVPSRSRAQTLHHVTGGNPLLVRELLDSIDAEGRSLDELRDDEISTFASESLVRRTRHRMARLGAAPTQVAQALAVLGDGAALDAIAEVADLDGAAAGRALDALVTADLVEGTRPAAFVHPLLRTAVEEQLGPFERSELHLRAARALARRDADPETIGLHLLATEPQRCEEHVTQLRRAASTALHRGAPATAIAFLQRAITEPPTRADRAAVLRILGEAELRDRVPEAVDHLSEALALTGDPRDRAAIAQLLANAHLFRSAWDVAVTHLRDAQATAGLDDPDLAGRIEGDLLTITALDDRTAPGDLPAVDRAEIRARAELPARRGTALTLALVEALQSRGAGVPELVATALADGAFLTDVTADSMAMVHAVDALVFVDALDEALTVARDMVADGERRASVLGVVAGLTHCGYVELRMGRLTDAAAHCEAALELATEHGLTFTIPFIAAYLALTLVAAGDVERARDVIEVVDPGVELAHTVVVPSYLEARGSVRVAGGDREGAARDLVACGDACGRLRITNPNVHEWRLHLVDALRVDEPAEADRLAHENLVLAEASGSERAIGVALRAVALGAADDERVDLLRRSVHHLEQSPCPLELARALLDLGACERRAGRTADAREHLLRSLQLATEGGATALSAQALDEAQRTGARPRRPWATGHASLTPAERRVAQLAAEGRTNREIAQSLFVTTKTVKTHLGAAYRKLGISRRTELRDHLDDRRR